MSMISEDIQIIQLDRMFVCKKLQINSNSQGKKYKKLLRLYRNTRVIKCTTMLCNLRLGMHLHPLHFSPASHMLLSPSKQLQPTIYIRVNRYDTFTTYNHNSIYSIIIIIMMYCSREARLQL